jgi:Fe-S cluster assembly protein SufD
MATGTICSGFGQETFDEFVASRDEPGWLIDLRRSVFRSFGELPMPGRKDEEWMRTDIRLFNLDDFGPAGEVARIANVPTALLAEGVELGGRTVSIDGHGVSAEIAPKWADQGVLFGSLDRLVAEHADKIRPHFMRQAFDPSFDKFAALHGAFWSGGTLLYVPRGVVLDEPLHSLSVMSDGAVDFGHTLVVLEDGAEATMLTEMTSTTESGSGLHCGAVELIVGNDAHLRYVNLQNWGRKVWNFAHQKAVVQRDASLQWTVGALGAKLAKVNQHVALVGEGASTQVNGTMFTEGRQHLSYHTLQHHQAPSTRSDFLYKSAVQDRSRTVWRGMIKVDQVAQQTDGYQRNDNLLLSTDARADSIPGLEIEADDVRCTHGATSGRVDEEQIFYACCRGFTRREAVRAIVTGFFQQIFDRITIDSVREALGLAIARRVRDYE